MTDTLTGSLRGWSSVVQAASSEESFRYQPPLDGLRAVAVLVVVFYHYNASFATAGYLGVDIFMVLSGYLITSLLAVELSGTGRIAFLKFWGRRIRRLLPALLVLLLLVGLYAWLDAPKVQLSRLRSDGLATLFYVQNWHLVDAGPFPSPLSHTWSLAIEEQWYLVWPPVFFGLVWLLRGRDRLLLLVVLALAIASASAMDAFGPGGRGYWGTDSRAQALLLGAALALLLRLSPGPARRGSRVALEVAGLLGAAVFAAMVVSPPSWMYHGGFFVAAIAAAAVIAASVQRESRLLRPLLSLTPLRWLGLISYGVYLYHFPILRWLDPPLPAIPLAFLRLAVTIAIATASYLLVELPVRRGTFLSPRAQVVLTPFAVGLAVMVLIVTTTGAPAARSRNAALWTYMRRTTVPDARRTLLLGAGDVTELAIAMQGPYDTAGVRGLAFGTSTCRLEDGSATAAETGGAACRRTRTQVREALVAYAPHTIVLQFGELQPGMESPERARSIEGVLDAIRTRRPTSQIAVLTPSCGALAPDPASVASRAWLDGVLRDVAARNPDVRLLGYDDALCMNGAPRAALHGVTLRDAEGVLTPAGARAIWTWVTEQLRAKSSVVPGG